MNKKRIITKYVAEELGLSNDDKSMRKLTVAWWQNTRTKDTGGLKLTSEGYAALTKAGIKEYRIRFDEPLPLMTNQQLVWMNNFIDCPYYLTNRAIVVFSQSIAVQLILFSGNIESFISAKARKLHYT